MVAQSTVNRCVTGSSPVTGAMNRKAGLPFGGRLFLKRINEIDPLRLGNVAPLQIRKAASHAVRDQLKQGKIKGDLLFPVIQVI